MHDWPFHLGELEAQVRAGGGARGGGVRGGAIREAMPDQHRAFFEALPFVVVASLDAGDGSDAGRPVATIWTGPPGFVRAPDAETLTFAVPATSSLRKFDEMKIRFHLDTVRAETAARIAIERFLFVPR